MHADLGRIHIDAMNKRRAKTSLKKYTSHFIWKGLWVRGSWRLNKDCNILTSQPLRTSPCVVLVLSCSTGGLGARPLWDMFSFQHLLTNWSGLETQSGVPRAPFAGWWLFLPHLLSNSSSLQLTDFLSHRVI